MRGEGKREEVREGMVRKEERKTGKVRGENGRQRGRRWEGRRGERM